MDGYSSNDDAISGDALILQEELNELLNSITHLERSNSELREALTSDPNDADFLQAVQENEGVLLKKQKRAEKLDEAILQITGKHPDSYSRYVKASPTNETAESSSTTQPAASEQSASASTNTNQTEGVFL
eukprot:2861-Heterococcus_DN1.PRE.6